jgi:hypothetical protein
MCVYMCACICMYRCVRVCMHACMHKNIVRVRVHRTHTDMRIYTVCSDRSYFCDQYTLYALIVLIFVTVQGYLPEKILYIHTSTCTCIPISTHTAILLTFQTIRGYLSEKIYGIGNRVRRLNRVPGLSFRAFFPASFPGIGRGIRGNVIILTLYYVPVWLPHPFGREVRVARWRQTYQHVRIFVCARRVFAGILHTGDKQHTNFHDYEIIV